MATNNNIKKAGARLKLLREKQIGVNQGDLLKGVDQVRISQAENGKVLLTSEHIIQLHAEHGINPNYYLLGIPPMFIDKQGAVALNELDKAVKAIEKAKNIINNIANNDGSI